MFASRPRTLFGKMLATIALVAAGFQIFSVGVIAYQMLIPLGKRSADDLAALMIEAAQQWNALEETARTLYEGRLESDLALKIRDTDIPLPPSKSWLPYRYFVEAALTRRQGQPVLLLGSIESNDEAWFWADIKVDGKPVRVGFPRSRIDVGPFTALLLVLAAGAWVSLLTAIVLAQRIAAPLERLANAAASVGKGRWPEPLPETGPRELALLTASFNRMTHQVRDLIANRTILLAGISHDLRTPIMQIMLAIEMLPVRETEADLLDGIRRDLDRMNQLIGQFLEVSRELDRSDGKPMRLERLLEELSDDYSGRGVTTVCACCENQLQVPHPIALRRILGNLIENALRYGESKPVEVVWICDSNHLTVEIRDRGPGIPEKEREAVFRPFYRLESSRSSETGGSGLGLAIVKQLAEAHGWRVHLASREGGGAVASVTLSVNR